VGATLALRGSTEAAQFTEDSKHHPTTTQRVNLRVDGKGNGRVNSKINGKANGKPNGKSNGNGHLKPELALFDARRS
jgi:hypothetical protein